MLTPEQRAEYIAAEGYPLCFYCRYFEADGDEDGDASSCRNYVIREMDLFATVYHDKADCKAFVPDTRRGQDGKPVRLTPELVRQERDEQWRVLYDLDGPPDPRGPIEATCEADGFHYVEQGQCLQCGAVVPEQAGV